jgi:hypothetical protein
MADLTLRSVKGSPLTNAELDGNFEYFTGSHAVTGSLIVTEDLIVSGSIIGNISGSVLVTTNDGVQITGSLIVSGSETFTNIGPMKTGAIGNVSLQSSMAQGLNTTAVAPFSHAEGIGVIAQGAYSHAEGFGTITSASFQHAQGIYNIASPVTGAFIVGNGDISARSNLIFAAGNQVEITGSLVVTGGITGTVTTASYATVAQTLLGSVVSASFATTASYINPTFISASAAASGFGSGGGSSIATGSFATTGSNIFRGTQTISGSTLISGSISHFGSLRTGDNANNLAINNSLAQGSFTSASGQYSHAEGESTVASGYASHTEGYFTNARDFATHAEGYYTNAGLTAWDTNGTFNGLTQLPSFIGNITSSFAPGTPVVLGTSYLVVSRSFFQSNLTQVQYVSQSNLNQSAGVPLALIDSTVYPNQTLRTGQNSHAEGESTLAVFGHAEGISTTAVFGHAEGVGTLSTGYGSHAEGLGTIARGDYQHVGGLYNTEDSSSLLVIGNGSDPNFGGTRSDAFKVRMSGSIVLPTTQSAAPSWTGTNGEMVFATVTGNHFFYVWMSGAWRSGSLS